MTPEREQLLDQNYALAPVDEAKEILKECRKYVYKATIERDFSAYPLLARLDKFLA